MPEGTETTLAIASPKSSSLRTTVPMWIVEQFGLKVGDSVFWKLDAIGKETRFIVEFIKRSSKPKK